MSHVFFRKEDRVISHLHKGVGIVTGTTVDEFCMHVMYVVHWKNGDISAYAPSWLILIARQLPLPLGEA